jgi:cytochrome oxidase assembly protein ShyY1
VLRTTLATLRQPRYAALSAVMVLVAIGCVGAGTWQIVRFDDKVRANDALTGNAHDAPVAVRDLLPVVGRGRAPGVDDIRYRTVTATGRYDAAHQALVRLQTVNDRQGYYVLTPLTTTSGTELLVVRGFVAERSQGSPPASIAAPPTGLVTVRARAQPGETRHDSPGGLPADQLVSINPVDQAARLRAPVYDGYAELEKGQPGAAGLTAAPAPDLSNPAGGAVEPQHFAYIIQWYLFAVLALAAPLAMARAERREQQAGADPDPDEAPAATHEVSDDERRAAKLADRYGRPVH